jgi:hypothetical protein
LTLRLPPAYVVAAGRWPLAAGRWPLAAGRWPLAATPFDTLEFVEHLELGGIHEEHARP